MPPLNCSKNQEAIIRMAFYSDDLLRLFKCYVDTVTAFLSDFADDKVLQTSGKTFRSFLNDERHFFYHQFEQKRTPCCKCPSHGCSIGRIRKMNKMMFETFYESTGTVEPGHEVVHGGCLQQRCIHRYVARNITLDDLDTTIICFLLYTKAALNPTEEAHIGTILKYRNAICHSWSTPKSFTSINTSKIWKELEVAILGLIPKPARQKMMKTLLQTHRQYQIEKEDSTAIAEVLEKVEQINKYLDGIDGLLGNHYEAEVTAEVIREQTEKIESCIKNQMQECYTAIIAQVSKFMEQRSEETGIKKDFPVGNTRIAMEYNVQDANVFEPEDSISGMIGDNTGVWHIKSPPNWNIKEIEELSTDNADLKEFKIKFKKSGSIWLITTVPKTFSTDHTTFELQIQSFITKLIEVCHFDTSTPCDVKVNLLILRNGMQLEVGSQGQNVDRSTQTYTDRKIPEKVYQTAQTDNVKRHDQITQTVEVKRLDQMTQTGEVKRHDGDDISIVSSGYGSLYMYNITNDNDDSNFQAHGMPNESASTLDRATFASYLRSEFYLSFSGKIMCVGHQAVGKTAIVTMLKGIMPTRSRKPTKVLDLQIYKAAIDIQTKKWICTVLTKFWVSSIVFYANGTTDSFPKILVVCTHKDKVPRDEADKIVNTIFIEIERMFEGTKIMKHLVLAHRIFLNALDSADFEYERLKTVLVELVCSQPTWGEKLPKSWIYLQLMINRSIGKGEPVMSMGDLRVINKGNPVQVLSEEDLELFLKTQHSQGGIIYFPLSNLRDHIIFPAFVVEALRSIFTSFRSGHRYKNFSSMYQNGVLKEGDFEIIWKENKPVLRHMKYFLNLLVHLDVLAIPRRYDNSDSQQHIPDLYYVPGLVTAVDTTDYFHNCDSRVLGVSFKFQSIMPPAIGNRLVASCIDMFEIKTFNGQVMLFSGMAIFNIKRDLDLAIFYKPDRVDIFFLHTQSRFSIIRDTASGIADCLKDLLANILKHYREKTKTVKASGIPLTIEYPCFDCSYPCYSNDKADWTCQHGYRITKELKHVWEINRMVKSCPEDCKGLGGRDLYEIPTDLQLVKLAQQLHWDDMFMLLIRLGFTIREIESIQDDYGINRLNVAFLYLRKWRLKTNGSVGDLLGAIKDMDLDIHAACKMLRNRPMDDLNDITNMEPTDQLLDSIANEAIAESLFLSIELGHCASVWLQMKDEREKIRKINRTVLHEWRVHHPRKDQMKDLAQALCNVGLDIASFLKWK